MNHPSLSALLAQLTPFRLLAAALDRDYERLNSILRTDNQYNGVLQAVILIVILIFLALVLIVGVVIFYLAFSPRRTHMTIPGRILSLLGGTAMILISLRLIYHVFLTTSRIAP